MASCWTASSTYDLDGIETLFCAAGTSKSRTNRRTLSYSSLEPRQLLAVITVNTAIDDGGLVPDGQISFREAMVAANTNAPFGDAPAGEELGDIIQFASTLAGETIQLNNGDFSITENLTIRGSDVSVDLAADQIDRLFEIETAEEVRLTGLSFVGGTFHDGPAISMSGGGTLRLTRTSFSGLNGGVSIIDSSLRVSESVFTGNSLRINNGGAISVTGGETSITGSTFRSNSAGAKGGAISFDGGSHIVSNSIFENNSTSPFGSPFPGSAGGAIHVDGSETILRVFGGKFEGNSANMGGAISSDGHLIIRNNTVFFENSIESPTTFVHGGAVQSTGRLSMVDSIVQSNSSTELGGGIFVGEGSALLNRIQLVDNHARFFGGGIVIQDANARLIDVIIEGNSSDFQGGGIHVSSRFEKAIVEIDGGAIVENSAASTGGGLYAGRYFLPSVVDVNVFVQIYGNTTIADNSTTRPYEDGDVQEPDGGGIYSEANLLQINNTSISGNTSVGSGGGIHVESGLTRLGNSSVTSNQAQWDGGGISINGGNVSLFQSSVGGDSPELGNRAGEFFANGARGLGGGVYVGNPDGGSRIFMSGGLLGNNIAKISGGGLAGVALNNVVRLENSVRIASNRALVEDGGGVYVDDSHLEIRDSLFEENSARNGGGIFLYGGSANLLGSSVQSNIARRTGGGIFSRGFLSLNDSLVVENVASFFDNVFDERETA